MQTQVHIITKCDKFLIRKMVTFDDGTRLITYMNEDGFDTSNYENSAKFDLQVEAESHFMYHSERVVSTLFFEKLE